MANKKTRLQKAQERYCDQLHEWLTNPQNDDLPNEIIEKNIETAFNEFFQSLIADENECADFIAKGCIISEMELLPMIFEHFKSKKIYDAIKSNCEVAFSHEFFIESDDIEQQRRDMLAKMKSML